jgi:group I intron endonuclease
MADSGIYEIINLVNGKRYVGSAISFKRRWTYHRRDLRAGKHHSKHLQASWNRHGEAAFCFYVIEPVVDTARLIEREQFYIDALKPEYNCRPTAGSNLGHRWTEEQKSRRSAGLKGLRVLPIGYKHSEETRRKLAEKMRVNPTFLGKSHTPETRSKISTVRKALLAEEGALNRLRAALARPEVREKKSANMAGNTIWLGRSHSDQTKELLRQRFTGRSFSDSTRKRMSESQRQRGPMSAETRAKMSVSRTGVRNGSAVLNVFCLENSLGQRVTGIPLELREQTGISPAGMTQLLKGQQKSAKGWRLVIDN